MHDQQAAQRHGEFRRLLSRLSDRQLEIFMHTARHAVTAHERTVARKAQDLRAMLLGSTSLPHLGMTIAEASRKTADLLAEVNTPNPISDERVDTIFAEVNRLETAVIALEPQTILDAACILDRIFPIDSRANLDRDIPAVRRVATLLHQIAEAARTASPVETSNIPSIGMTFRQAADRVHELLERGNTILEDDPEDDAAQERVEAERIADCREWNRIENAMMSTPARTIGDLLAKLERVVDPDIGVRTTVPNDAEIIMLEEDVKRLRPLLAGPDLSVPVDGRHPDAGIFSAYSRWAQLMRDCEASETDEDTQRLHDEADATAPDLMACEPATVEGLAAQVFLMLHLEHGGTVADVLDINFESNCEKGGAAEFAVRTLLHHVKRLGRRDGGETPQGALTGLYERWVEVHARYLADGLSEEEHEAAEAELDAIEDRLDLEPVRHLGDAIVKLGYFLTKSNQVLDDELLPSIDANSSRPWPRLLFLIEGGTEQLPTDLREPFRAMVTGLRQLMQRHVKLAEEAERRAGAYQLPEQVSQAMQAVCTRNRAASAEKDGRMPDQAQEQREETLSLLQVLEPGSRKRYLSFMRFLAVSSHLYGAMRDFAHEHGMTTEYRQWLEGHLADLASEQGNAVANDQHQNADTFADTVAAFEAAAPNTLALPLEPTGRMVDAGASAAGITPAQFQAAYAAAVEALKLERAA